MNEPISETVVCPCGKRADAVQRSWKYYAPPEGWVVVDPSPPGDMGLEWRCSWECVEKFHDDGEP